MKLETSFIFLILTAVKATVIPPYSTSIKNYGVHSEYVDIESGRKIQFLVEGFNGTSSTVMVTSNFTQTTSFRKILPGTESSAIENRDVCEYITSCAGKAAESAKAFAAAATVLTTSVCAQIANGMNNYLSANNYANANTIIQGTVISVLVNIGTTPITYYLNAALDRYSAGSKSDACGQTQAPTYSGDAASAIYQFCLAIQAEVGSQSSVTTRFDASDVPSSTSTSASPNGGQQGLAKFFISSQAFAFAPVCSDWGIVWKREEEERLTMLETIGS